MMGCIHKLMYLIMYEHTVDVGKIIYLIHILDVGGILFSYLYLGCWDGMGRDHL